MAKAWGSLKVAASIRTSSSGSRPKETQRIVFIEPHGMLNQKAYIHDEKARLHERLPELARDIAGRSGNMEVAA